MDELRDEDLYAILQVGPDADAAALRAAYLAGIRACPPERDPAGFERIRDAYQALSQPDRKMRRLLAADPPGEPLAKLLDSPGATAGRAYLGVEPWLDLLRRLADPGSDKRSGA